MILVLDYNSVIKLRKLLISLKEEFAMSIIFSSHNLSEIEKVSDRIIFIKEGEIIKVEDSISDFYYEIEIDKDISDRLKEIDVKFRLTKPNTFFVSDIEDLNTFLKIVYMNSAKICKIEKNYYSLEAIYEKIYQV